MFGVGIQREWVDVEQKILEGESMKQNEGKPQSNKSMPNQRFE